MPMNPSDAYREGYARLLELQSIIASKHLDTEQAKALVRKFPPDFMLRVEVVLALFARVVDLENDEVDLLPQEGRTRRATGSAT